MVGIFTQSGVLRKNVALTRDNPGEKVRAYEVLADTTDKQRALADKIGLFITKHNGHCNPVHLEQLRNGTFNVQDGNMLFRRGNILYFDKHTPAPSAQPAVPVNSVAARVYKYDFGLSFAGSNRAQAEELARRLQAEGVRVFYDFDEQATLWGEDLYQKFQQIYGNECRFFIPFVSANYVDRLWPKHELKQAQARAFKSNTAYILPIRFDDTEVPGLNDTTGYISAQHHNMEQIAELCLKKLVNDSAVRRLFMFLRDHNPNTIAILQNEHPTEITIRVATSNVRILEDNLSKIASTICSGRNNHNVLMNGGQSGADHPSSDPEPHTTFTLTFGHGFYDEVSV